jgi:hypothetical protein
MFIYSSSKKKTKLFAVVVLRYKEKISSAIAPEISTPSPSPQQPSITLSFHKKLFVYLLINKAL